MIQIDSPENEPATCGICESASIPLNPICPRSTFQLTQCPVCSQSYHQACYLRKKGSTEAKCDSCRYEPKRSKCLVCHESSGILKRISKLKYIHILCALTSPSIDVKSYSNFSIEEMGINSERKEGKEKCQVCKKDTEHLLMCQFCPSVRHYSCKKSEQNFVGLNLAKNQNQFFIFEAINPDLLCEEVASCFKSEITRANSSNSSIFSMRRLMVCENQFSRYCWCTCDKSDENDEVKNPSVMCDGCDRYIHLKCSGLSRVDEEKKVYCSGCQNNDRYGRLIRLPELLFRLQQLEQKTSAYTMQELKFLNSIPFKYSQKIKHTLPGSIRQIELFLLLSHIKYGNNADEIEKYGDLCRNYFQSLPKDSQDQCSQMFPSITNQLRTSQNLPMQQQDEPPNQDSGLEIIEQINPAPQEHQSVVQESPDPLMAKIGRVKQSLSSQPPEVIDNFLKEFFKLEQIKLVMRPFEGDEQKIDFYIYEFVKMLGCEPSEKHLQYFYKSEEQTDSPSKQSEEVKDSSQLEADNMSNQNGRAHSNSQKERESESVQADSENKDRTNIDISLLSATGSKFEIISKVVCKFLQSSSGLAKILECIRNSYEAEAQDDNGKLSEKAINLIIYWGTISKELGFGTPTQLPTVAMVNKAYKLMLGSGYPQNSVKKYITDRVYVSLQAHYYLRFIRNKKKNFDRNPITFTDLSYIHRKEQAATAHKFLAFIEKNKDLVDGVCEQLEIKTYISQSQSEMSKSKGLKYLMESSNYNELMLFIECANQSSHIDISYNEMSVVQYRFWNEQCRSRKLRDHYRVRHASFDRELSLFKTLQEKVYTIRPNVDSELQWINTLPTNPASINVMENALVGQPRGKRQDLSVFIKQNEELLQSIEKFMKEPSTFEDMLNLEIKASCSLFDNRAYTYDKFGLLRRKMIEFENELIKKAPYGLAIPAGFRLEENIYKASHPIAQLITKEPIMENYAIRLYKNDCKNWKQINRIKIQLQEKAQTKTQGTEVVMEALQVYENCSPYLASMPEFQDALRAIIHTAAVIFQAQDKLKEIEGQRRVRSIQMFWFRAMNQCARLLGNNGNAMKQCQQYEEEWMKKIVECGANL